MGKTCASDGCRRSVTKYEYYCTLHGGRSGAERQALDAANPRSRRVDTETKTIFAMLLLMVFLVGLFIFGQVQDHRQPAVKVASCTDADVAFRSWLTQQSSVYGEDLNTRYGVQSVTAVCGDVTVATLIAEDVAGYDLAESACNLLSGAVGQATGVKSVTVQYGTGKNACFKWPGGPSHFG